MCMCMYQVAALLGGDEAAARLVGVSEHCDHPAALVAGRHVVSRAAVVLEGMDGAQVEAALRAAKQSGLEAAHVVDVDWLRRERPALLLTQVRRRTGATASRGLCMGRGW